MKNRVRTMCGTFSDSNVVTNSDRAKLAIRTSTRGLQPQSYPFASNAELGDAPARRSRARGWKAVLEEQEPQAPW